MRTTPDSTHVRYVATHAGFASGLVTLPVSRLIFQAWSGQTTVSPVTIPSANGPPLWGHRPSTANTRSPRLKIAISRPATFTERPSLKGIFCNAVIRIHFLLLMPVPFPTAQFARTVWDAAAHRLPAKRLAKYVWIFSAAPANPAG